MPTTESAAEPAAQKPQKPRSQLHSLWRMRSYLRPHLAEMIWMLVAAVLIFIRRWTQTTSALGMEARQRNDLYAHLQRLPVAFHDEWESGQLLSRATSD